MKLSTIIVLTAAALLFGACATVSSDQFLISNLDNNEKSDILTNKGIVYYEQQLSNNENYLLIPKSKAFFENALVYNPENAIAKKYLDRLNAFISDQVARNLAAAQKYRAKENKSEQDVFNLCYFTQKAYEVDPDNPDVIALKEEIHRMQEDLISEYIRRGNKSLEELDAADSSEDRQKIYLDAHNNFGRALLLDPEHSGAAEAQRGVKESLTEIGTTLIASLESEIEAGVFTDFDDSVKRIRFLNAKTDNSLGEDIRHLNYLYHFRRSRIAYGEKDYRRAEIYINNALSALRSQEALDFRETVRRQRSAANANRAFGELLSDIDTTISEGNLLDADTALRSMKRNTNDRNQIRQIDKRLTDIHNSIPALYSRGVEKYRNEQYGEAVDILEIVVALDASYEQAASYLEKAKGRLRILESF